MKKLIILLLVSSLVSISNAQTPLCSSSLFIGPGAINTNITSGIITSAINNTQQGSTFISSGNNVTFSAGVRVRLRPGFRAISTSNTRFIARNVACTNPRMEVLEEDSASNLISNSYFSISPNPTSSSFTIATNFVGESIVYIYDALGREIYSSLMIGKTQEVNLSQETDGIYIVKVQNNESIKVQKLIFKK